MIDSTTTIFADIANAYNTLWGDLDSVVFLCIGILIGGFALGFILKMARVGARKALKKL